MAWLLALAANRPLFAQPAAYCRPDVDRAGPGFGPPSGASGIEPAAMKARADFAAQLPMTVIANKRSALDARTALFLHIKTHWPGASESERWPKLRPDVFDRP